MTLNLTRQDAIRLAALCRKLPGGFAQQYGTRHAKLAVQLWHANAAIAEQHLWNAYAQLPYDQAQAWRAGIAQREATAPKFGIWAVRGAGSVAGPGQAWMKHDGKRQEFATRGEAQAKADQLNANTRSPHLSYGARQITE